MSCAARRLASLASGARDLPARVGCRAMRWSRGGGLRAAGAIAATVGAFVCAVPAAATPGALQIAGTPGDDQIAIDATSADTGSYSVNGGAAQLFAAATRDTGEARDGTASQ